MRKELEIDLLQVRIDRLQNHTQVGIHQAQVFKPTPTIATFSSSARRFSQATHGHGGDRAQLRRALPQEVEQCLAVVTGALELTQKLQRRLVLAQGRVATVPQVPQVLLKSLSPWWEASNMISAHVTCLCSHHPIILPFHGPADRGIDISPSRSGSPLKSHPEAVASALPGTWPHHPKSRCASRSADQTHCPRNLCRLTGIRAPCPGVGWVWQKPSFKF